MLEKNIVITTKIIIIGIALFSLTYLLFFYLSSDYQSFLHYFLVKTERTESYNNLLHNEPHFRNIYHPFTLQQYQTLVQDENWSFIYAIAKWVMLLAYGTVLYIIYDLVTIKRGWISKKIEKKIAAISSSIYINIRYIKNLDAPTKIILSLLLATQLFFLAIFLFQIPFEYDEALSYFAFSSRGLLQTATFYPCPNNHILFNLIASFFTILPIGPEISTRLPNIIAYFITEYYFLKLAKNNFSIPIALISTTLFASAYPIIFYAASARGYELLFLFTILSWYALNEWKTNLQNKKYPILYVCSMICAIYTIPSAAIILLSLSAGILLYLAQQSQWKAIKKFIIYNCIIGGIASILYIPILYYNGRDSLGELNGFTPLTYAELASSCISILDWIWQYLMGGIPIPLYLAILPILACIIVIARKNNQSLSAWISLILILSPIPVLFVTKLVPVQRLYAHLIMPISISTGILLTSATPYLKTAIRKIGGLTELKPYARPLLTILLLSSSIFLFANFQSFHKASRPVVYFVDNLFKNTGHEKQHIRSIGYTSEYFSQYITQCMLYKCYMLDPHKPIDIHPKTEKILTDFEVSAPIQMDSATRSQYDSVDSYYYFSNGYKYVTAFIKIK